MNSEQLRVLTLRETDVEAAVRRCCGDEQLYVSCMMQFLDDETMGDLLLSVHNKAWDDAFTAAHALKGLAGNLGFIPLMHSTGRLVVLIRGGRTDEVAQSLEDVRSCYRDITDAIKHFISKQSD